ncbi:hypothetical protein KM918_20795 [Priestia megaterium]|uniref:hypothetical protein n=1 Tax=Priestia megaterium TaxID=1404 RepID=UPI001C21B70D|nr:hypothetical protein [Priestia megaterium]MBU8689756.1 hypothetical protein [Priestia megaterium]
MDRKVKATKTKDIIQEYEELRFFYQDTERKINEIKDEQQQLLLRTIEKLQPELEWLLQRNYYFIHPALGDFKFTRGPILGMEEGKQYVYIYDIKKQSLIKGDTSDDFKFSNVTALDVINAGLFMDAMEGILYTRELLNEYNNRIGTVYSNLKADLENYTRIFHEL